MSTPETPEVERGFATPDSPRITEIVDAPMAVLPPGIPGAFEVVEAPYATYAPAIRPLAHQPGDIPVISSRIFNANKTDYKTPSVFLGEDMGLLDTINRPYPIFDELYNKMRAFDWNEREFPFITCKIEFKQCPKSIYEIMIRTIAWQWAADSTAARSLVPIIAPFLTNSDLMAAWWRVGENEVLHGRTYSEMVKQSFDDPDDAMKQVLEVTEAMQRIQVVSDIFDEVYTVSHRYALGEMTKDDPRVYEAIFMFAVAMWALERIQFMASFAMTFAIANLGMFVPFGKAVQKICQDENEVHQVIWRKVLEIELATDRGMATYHRLKSRIKQVVDAVVESEINWNTDLLSNGRELPGVTIQGATNWILYNAKPVYEFFALESTHAFPAQNPFGWIKEWISISEIQGAAQEEKLGSYVISVIEPDSDGVVYSTDGL